MSKGIYKKKGPMLSAISNGETNVVGIKGEREGGGREERKKKEEEGGGGMIR